MTMDKESKEKTKALDLALNQIERQFGKGSIMKLGSRSMLDIPVISTSSLSVDYALGVGGVPRGRVSEIYGPESSGKTTLALHLVAEARPVDLKRKIGLWNVEIRVEGSPDLVAVCQGVSYHKT